MPRRSILSAAERESLLELPDTQDELIRHYTFSEPDLSLIRQRRGEANRLGTSRNLPCSPEPGLRLHKSSAGEQLMSAARRCPHRRGTPRRVFPPHAGCADAPALLTSHTSRRAL